MRIARARCRNLWNRIASVHHTHPTVNKILIRPREFWTLQPLPTLNGQLLKDEISTVHFRYITTLHQLQHPWSVSVIRLRNFWKKILQKKKKGRDVWERTQKERQHKVL